MNREAYADNEQIRLAQEFLTETFAEHGLFYNGHPVVLWNPMTDLVGALKQLEDIVNIEHVVRVESSVMLSKALIAIRKR